MPIFPNVWFVSNRQNGYNIHTTKYLQYMSKLPTWVPNVSTTNVIAKLNGCKNWSIKYMNTGVIHILRFQFVFVYERNLLRQCSCYRRLEISHKFTALLKRYINNKFKIYVQIPSLSLTVGTMKSTRFFQWNKHL